MARVQAAARSGHRLPVRERRSALHSEPHCFAAVRAAGRCVLAAAQPDFAALPTAIAWRRLPVPRVGATRLSARPAGSPGAASSAEAASSAAAAGSAGAADFAEAARQAQRLAQPEALARQAAARPPEEPVVRDAAAAPHAAGEAAAVLRAVGEAAEQAEAAVPRAGAVLLRAVRGVPVALPSAAACLPCRVRLPAPQPAARFGRAMDGLRIASP
jgi:hypothetical protein